MMKKLLLTGMAFSVCIAVNAQNRPAPIQTIKDRLQLTNHHAPVPMQPAISGNEMPLKPVNPTVASPASSHKSSSANMAQVVVGNSTYDLQTNGSIDNRIYNNGGSLAATWTFSTDLAGTYPDRGTGYAYYDGSTWSAAPTARIESDRRGWPTIVHLANGGEAVVSHGSLTNPTAISARTTAGSGSWTQTPIPGFTTGENTLWARTAAGGPDGNTIHMIDISYPVGNSGTLVNGLDGCLNYSRSLDGGATWDIQRVLPPGVNDQEYIGFRADGYAMDAKDNVVAFVSGNITDDWALWKSTDNGTTFTRTVIQDFPFTKYDGTTQITDVDGDGIADTVLTTDGSYAILIDNNGMVHCWAGAMLVLDNDPATAIGLFLSTNGLLYWNESMGSNPPVVIATAPDRDGDGTLTYAADLGGRYGNDGVCSMPSAGIDAAGNIYVSYCPLMENTDSGNPSPNAFSYRNVYLMGSSDNGATWGTSYNVSNSDFDEGVFCAMAKNVDNCVHLLWQQDGAPGYSVPPNGEHPIGNNDFIYDCVTPSTVISSVNETLTPEVSVSIYPNPAVSNVMVSYSSLKSMDIKVEIRNVMGQVVNSFSKKMENGTNSYSVNVEKLSSGIYTVNTIMGEKVYSTKFVKK